MSARSAFQLTIFSGVCDVAGINVSKSCDCKLPAMAIWESFPVAVPLNEAWPFSVTGICPAYPAAAKTGCHSPRLVVVTESLSAAVEESVPEA